MDPAKPPATEPQPNDSINRAMMYDRAFSPEECDTVIQLARQISSQDGVLDANSESYRQVRKSSVRFVDYEPGLQWVFAKLRNLALTANQAYRFEIVGFRERLQLAEYGVGDHFDWHMDMSGGATSLRKISISVLLSDPADFEGGDLEFFRTPARPQDRSRGAAAVFPSFLPHRVAPVTRGSRFSLVAWIAGAPFR